MYFPRLFQRAFDDTWNVVFGQSFWTVMIAGAIFVSTLFWLRCRNRHEEVKTRLRDFGIAALFTAAAFVFVFLFHLLVLTPKTLWDEEHQTKQPSATVPQPTPFKLDVDVTDSQARRELADTKKKLEHAEATIRTLDPLQQTIASARFSLLINFKTKKEDASNYFGSGAGVLLITGDRNILLQGGVAQHSSDGEGHSQVLVECAYDSPAIGKPVSSLTSAKFLAVQFADGFVPVGTELSESRVILLINNGISVTFSLPPVTVTEEVPGKQKSTRIVLTNLEKELAALATPPSPTPHTEASQR